MPRYLEITDGTTSVRLDGNSSTDYFAVRGRRWTPKIAKRKDKAFAGSLFEDVEENIPLIIQSTADAETVLDNIEALNGLIEQAGRWFYGEDVDPVIFRFSPTSNSDYLECAVLGAPETAPAITLPPNFEEYLGVRRIIGVSLSFMRRGQWLDDEVTRVNTRAQGVAGSVTFAETPVSPSPVKVTVDPSSCLTGVSTFSSEGYLLFGNDSNDIEVIDLGGTAFPFTPEVHLGNEYKTISVGASSASFTEAAAGTMPARRVAVFAVLGVSGSYVNIRFGCNTDTEGAYKYAPWSIIPNSNPAPVYLGTISFPAGNIQNLRISYKGSATLNIDYLCMFNVANSSNVALRYIFDQSRTDDMVIDHALLERSSPLIEVGTGYYPGYQGNPTILSEAQSLHYIHLGTNMTGGWREICGGEGVWSPLNFAFTFKRRLGTLVPH